ncbi:MAG: cadmium-translocating P-type ATPase [Gammaproteobacteria bacterium]|jgi:Cu2+-exporting ATPase|nr:cadmium-translocating P-type ATPase [Gammaproteobacteria bacterium]
MEITENACFHCGESIPDGISLYVLRDGQQRPVCCAGCLAVAELIFGTGLGRYYQFRQELGRKAEQDSMQIIEAWQGCDSRENLWGSEREDGRRELLLQTEGIRCAACAWLIRSHMENMTGVKAVQVDTATGYTRIIWNPLKTRLSRLAGALLELGYKPHLPLAEAEEQGRQEERRASMKRLGVAGLGMMQVMMYAVGLYAGDAFGMKLAERSFLEWVSLLVTLPVVLYSGRVFFEGAWHSLRAHRPGMDVPVALAIGLAFAASCINFFRGEGTVWFDSVVMFIFFLTLGRHVELNLRHRNLQAGAALARLLPEWAELLQDGNQETVPAMDLKTGDLVRVSPGEAFPADGIICNGATEVDESLLSGESMPLSRGAGDPVIAGSINLSQPVDLEVTAGGAETTVSAMGRMLLKAQIQKESVHGLPGWLVPAFIVAVLMLASLTWIGWSFRDPAIAFPAMLSVLVASCPCALSLALPAVYAAASQRLLNEGVMLTRGDALKALCHVDTVVFDKTGTLTHGHPQVIGVHLNPERGGVSREQAMDIAGRIESASAHPLARAFPRPSGVATDVRVVAGMGIEARVDGRHCRLGQADFAAPGIRVDSYQAKDTEIWLADDGGWLARFTICDSLRKDAARAVAQLAADDLEISILSGDSEAAVKRVAELAGIDDWQARQSPENKQQQIESMKNRGQSILMVGDGVNDAPVLTTADASMTVKGGSELANSVADLILTGDSLMLVVTARDVAKQSQALIHQNLAWALLYNVSVLPLAVSGMLQPWMAALGMSLSSLVVVINATRLVRRTSHQPEAL